MERRATRREMRATPPEKAQIGRRRRETMGESGPWETKKHQSAGNSYAGSENT